MRIDPIIRNLQENPAQVKKPGTVGQESFADQLKSKIGEVDRLQGQAEDGMAQGAIDGASSVHETMIRLEEADLSLRFLTRVRNKAMDAYHEIMRMQF